MFVPKPFDISTRFAVACAFALLAIILIIVFWIEPQKREERKLLQQQTEYLRQKNAIEKQVYLKAIDSMARKLVEADKRTERAEKHSQVATAKAESQIKKTQEAYERYVRERSKLDPVPKIDSSNCVPYELVAAADSLAQEAIRTINAYRQVQITKDVLIASLEEKNKQLNSKVDLQSKYVLSQGRQYDSLQKVNDKSQATIGKLERQNNRQKTAGAIGGGALVAAAVILSIFVK